MKKIFLCALALCLGLQTLPAYGDSDGLYTRAMRRVIKKAKLSDVCRNIRSVNFLIKADMSGHIPSYDRRQGSYSVIGSRSNCSPCPSGKCGIYYHNGEKAGDIGYYGQWLRSKGGNGCARYYGGSGGAARHSANTIIRNSKTKGKYLYLQVNSRTKTCYKWTGTSRRVGGT